MESGRSVRLSMGLMWAAIALCLVAALAAFWVDITITRLAANVFYYLFVGPIAIALASLVMKLLGRALFGWNLPYTWLVAITGFAFLSFQVLEQANHLLYNFVWRFSRFVNLLATAANFLLFSAIVATFLKIASGRQWRQAFTITLVGTVGLGLLVLVFARFAGLRPPIS